MKLDERGLGRLLLLTVFAFVVAAAAGGVVAFLLLRGGAQPPDQTARFLPAHTQIYFSLNLRPGDNQLKKFRDILKRFRQGAGFQGRVDELLDDAKDETGIDLKEDVLPWLGPELAAGVVDVVGSAVRDQRLPPVGVGVTRLDQLPGRWGRPDIRHHNLQRPFRFQRAGRRPALRRDRGLHAVRH